jgi:hypothetical protein
VHIYIYVYIYIYIYTHTHTHTERDRERERHTYMINIHTRASRQLTSVCKPQIDPNHVKSLCNYAVLLRDGDKDIEAARTLMERARQVAPDDDWFKQIDQETEWSKHVNVRPGKVSVGVRAGNTATGIPVSNAGSSMDSGKKATKQRKKNDSRPSLEPIERNSGVSVYRGGAFQDGQRIPPHPEAEYDFTRPGARLPRGMTQDNIQKLRPEDVGIHAEDSDNAPV